MKRPDFEFEVYELLGVQTEDYLAQGIKGNPFHSFSNKTKPSVEGREDLMTRLDTEFRGKNKFPYLTGNPYGGSGKSAMLTHQFQRWAATENVIAIRVSNCVKYRYPNAAVEEVKRELRQFTDSVVKKTLVIVLDEVEFSEIFELAVEKADIVLAGGHFLARDAGLSSARFQEIDLDMEYPLEQDLIVRHLLEMLRDCRGEKAVHSEVANFVAEHAENIGQAETVIGLLLANWILRARKGRSAPVSRKDAQFWLEVYGTNWYWFSMDAFKIENPLRLNIEIAEGGQIWRGQVEIKIKASVSPGILLRRSGWSTESSRPI